MLLLLTSCSNRNKEKLVFNNGATQPAVSESVEDKPAAANGSDNPEVQVQVAAESGNEENSIPQTAASNPSGFGLKDRAPYLRHSPLAIVPDAGQLRRFITDMRSTAVMSMTLSDDPEKVSETCEALVYGGEPGCGTLIISAHYCDLTYTGTFLNKFDCRKQYDYLTSANGFEKHPLSWLGCMGGEGKASAGDVIFWFNNAGEPVNAGLITAADSSFIETVVSAGEGLTASFELNANNIGSCLNGAEIIRIRYPDSEYQIFAFLTGEMGYSKAASCGILANIYKESSYRTGGDSVMGICQWTADRKQSLMDWCSENRLDYTSLYGQLKYMQHELRTDFSILDSFLLSCGDTEDDAFNAAKEWCIQFEKPAEAYTVGTDRGMLAKETIYPMYGG